MIKYMIVLFLVISQIAYSLEVEKLSIENHCYILIDNISYIHDPDCPCHNGWHGFVYDKDENFSGTIRIKRYVGNDYD